MKNSNLLSLLRENTNALHNSLEGIMYSDKIKDRTLNVKELGEILNTNFIFFNQLEETLVNFEDLNQFQIRKAYLAKNDIQKLEFSINDSQDFKLPKLSLDEIIGYLYVALGSSLGGMMISKALDKNKNVPAGSYSFYENSKESFTIWKLFLEKLSYWQDKLNHEMVVKGAISAFNDFKNIQIAQHTT